MSTIFARHHPSSRGGEVRLDRHPGRRAAVRLLNPLRLSKEKRQKLIDTQRQLDTDAEHAADIDQEALLSESIRIVAATPKQATFLLDAVGGDLAVLAEIFAEYSKGAQVGEASASRD